MVSEADAVEGIVPINSFNENGNSKNHRIPRLQIHVMNSLEHRDALFASKIPRFDPKKTIFVWDGVRVASDGKSFDDPFTEDDTGRRIMRYLCLIASWEGQNLADSLFSALGIRVVDALHSAEKM